MLATFISFFAAALAVRGTLLSATDIVISVAEANVIPWIIKASAPALPDLAGAGLVAAFLVKSGGGDGEGGVIAFIGILLVTFITSFSISFLTSFSTYSSSINLSYKPFSSALLARFITLIALINLVFLRLGLGIYIDRPAYKDIL